MTRDQITFVLEQFHAYRRLQGHAGKPLMLQVTWNGGGAIGEFTGLHLDKDLLFLVPEFAPMAYVDISAITHIAMIEV